MPVRKREMVSRLTPNMYSSRVCSCLLELEDGRERVTRITPAVTMETENWKEKKASLINV